VRRAFGEKPVRRYIAGGIQQDQPLQLKIAIAKSQQLIAINWRASLC
tara:strand:+ start:282 stop:422 length:141 start_codon:yes stop_codon:yes gene_type:complete